MVKSFLEDYNHDSEVVLIDFQICNSDYNVNCLKVTNFVLLISEVESSKIALSSAQGHNYFLNR